MRLYISSVIEHGYYRQLPQLFHYYPNRHLLASYEYLKNKRICEDTLDELIANKEDVMIDSGMFTYLNAFWLGKSITYPNFRDYMREYAHWIKRHKIEKFIEIDVDPIIGYPKTLDLRKELEDITGKPSIVVYHPESRTRDEFMKSCETNKYVAYGTARTLADGESSCSRSKLIMDWKDKVDLAHSMGCKIHGLAKTGYDAMSQCGFDSVDSASWTGIFRGQIIEKTPDGKAVKTRKLTDDEWTDIDKKRAMVKKSWSFARWSRLQRFADEQLSTKWPEMLDIPEKPLTHPDYEFPSYHTVFQQMYEGQDIFGGIVK